MTHLLCGRNIIVLDLETLSSAQDCVHCGFPDMAHDDTTDSCPGEAGSEHLHDRYQPIGWENHAALGLSVGCYWDCQDSNYHWFNRQTLPTVIDRLVRRNALLVTFNGRQFDCPLIGAVAETTDEALEIWQQYWERESYDILHEIWQVDPERKFKRGLNGLDTLCQANGLPRKEMDGATAPRLWAQGRIAEVCQYCMNDVLRTRLLFEKLCEGQLLIRGDGLPIALPIPPWLRY